MTAESRKSYEWQLLQANRINADNVIIRNSIKFI